MIKRLIDRYLALNDEFKEELMKTEQYIERVALNQLNIKQDISSFVVGRGKRIRSILLFLFAGEERHESLYKISAILELIHFATLLHDDVIDDNNTRRNGKSFKKEYGNKLSILTGDYIISKACSLLFSSNIDRYVQKSFIRESCSTAYGAYLEHHLSKAPTVENYIRVASLKTGSLFKLACLTGSCISKKPFATIRQSATFGKCLGIIFQIQNDVDAYMHKHHAQSEDFIQKNITFPIVLMKKHGLLCIQEFINKNECCIFQKIKEFINSNNFSSLASAVYDKYLKKIYDFSAQMPSEYSLIHAP